MRRAGTPAAAGIVTAAIGCALAAAPARAHAFAEGKQAALIHLDTGPKVKPAEVEPLERALAADLTELGFTIVWAEPAVTNLAIGVDPKRCVDVGCRQKLASALDSKLVAGGKVDRRRDPVLGNVVDLSVWLMDPDKGKMVGEANEQCAKCSAADVEAKWLSVLRVAEEKAGLVEKRRAPPPRPAPPPPDAFAAKAQAEPAPEAAPGATSGESAAPEAEATATVGETDTNEGGFRFGDLFRKKMVKLYLAGAGVALGAAGVTFILIDGPRFDECSKSLGCTSGQDRKPQRYKTLLPGILMTAGAAVLLAGAGYVWFQEHKEARAGDVAVVPAIGPAGDVALGAGLQWVTW